MKIKIGIEKVPANQLQCCWDLHQKNLLRSTSEKGWIHWAAGFWVPKRLWLPLLHNTYLLPHKLLHAEKSTRTQKKKNKIIKTKKLKEKDSYLEEVIWICMLPDGHFDWWGQDLQTLVEERFCVSSFQICWWSWLLEHLLSLFFWWEQFLLGTFRSAATAE